VRGHVLAALGVLKMASTDQIHRLMAPAAEHLRVHRAAPPLGGGEVAVVDHEGARHCRDHERLPQVSETLITWASITLMTRRLTRTPPDRLRAS
jgi:hypothetical protein